MRYIKKIPDASVEFSCKRFLAMIKNYSDKEINTMVRLSLKYPPATRALLGALLGLLFSVAIDNIPFNSAAVPMVDTYPVDYGIQYYAIAVIFAVATTYFAGWFPSRKASVVDPVEIIRGK